MRREEQDGCGISTRCRVQERNAVTGRRVEIRVWMRDAERTRPRANRALCHSLYPNPTRPSFLIPYSAILFCTLHRVEIPQPTSRMARYHRFSVHFPVMSERTPPLGTPANDPEQLPLGVFEGMPFLPVGEKGRGDEGGPGDGEAAVAVREPPVCGEWSFDLSDDAEGRSGATFVD